MPCRQDLHLHFNTYFNSLTIPTDSSTCFTMKAVSAVIALTCFVSFSTSHLKIRVIGEAIWPACPGHVHAPNKYPGDA